MILSHLILLKTELLVFVLQVRHDSEIRHFKLSNQHNLLLIISINHIPTSISFTP